MQVSTTPRGERNRPGFPPREPCESRWRNHWHAKFDTRIVQDVWLLHSATAVCIVRTRDEETGVTRSILEKVCWETGPYADSVDSVVDVVALRSRRSPSSSKSLQQKKPMLDSSLLDLQMSFWIVAVHLHARVMSSSLAPFAPYPGLYDSPNQSYLSFYRGRYGHGEVFLYKATGPHFLFFLTPSQTG
jgi:hypothetical protein